MLTWQQGKKGGIVLKKRSMNERSHQELHIFFVSVCVFLSLSRVQVLSRIVQSFRGLGACGWKVESSSILPWLRASRSTRDWCSVYSV